MDVRQWKCDGGISRPSGHRPPYGDRPQEVRSSYGIYFLEKEQGNGIRRCYKLSSNRAYSGNLDISYQFGEKLEMILQSHIPTIDELQPLFGKSGLPRSSGIHVSSVIRYVYLAMNSKPEDGPIDYAAMCQFEKGFIWEEALSRAFADRHVVRPGEIVKDEVAGNPDGLEYSDAKILVWLKGLNLWVEEYKCTTKSAGRELSEEKDWLWINQVKCYCAMVNTLYARFWILHICGNYRDIREPLPKIVEIAFTQEEVDSAWRMVMNHKDLVPLETHSESGD